MLIRVTNVTICLTWSRLPQGRCGCWLEIHGPYQFVHQSPSARKVWIEIISFIYHRRKLLVAFRKEGVDWNWYTFFARLSAHQSPSARKVWIEIRWYLPGITGHQVAFRKEGVDWNKRLFVVYTSHKRRLPQGRCGLKSIVFAASSALNLSPSARKVRIKILTYFSRHFTSPSLHIPCWQRTSLSQGI